MHKTSTTKWIHKQLKIPKQSQTTKHSTKYTPKSYINQQNQQVKRKPNNRNKFKTEHSNTSKQNTQTTLKLTPIRLQIAHGTTNQHQTTQYKPTQTQSNSKQQNNPHSKHTTKYKPNHKTTLSKHTTKYNTLNQPKQKHNKQPKQNN